MDGTLFNYFNMYRQHNMATQTWGGGGSASGGDPNANPQPGTSSQWDTGMPSTSYGGENNPVSIYGHCGPFVAGFKEPPPALAETPAGLPHGKYKIVSLEIDTTGRRLIDEICQIAAYAFPGLLFQQYIMPYGDLTPGARRRHRMRIFNTGRFRMLKSLITYKVLKTKSEYGALTCFMEWLECIKNEDEKIILLYHDPRRLNTIMLMQAILRYNLLDQFQNIVAGFSDSFALCHNKCGTTFKSVSLKTMASLLLDEGMAYVESGVERATAIYNILEQLANQGGELYDEAVGGVGYGIGSLDNAMIELACEFGRPIDTEIEAFYNLKDLIARQDTFRSVLVPLLNGCREERRQLTRLRRKLAEAGLLFDQVKDAWHDAKRNGIINLLIPVEQIMTPDEMVYCVQIFVSHFEPAREPPFEQGEEAADNTEEQDELYWSTDDDDSEGYTASYVTEEDYLNY